MAADLLVVPTVTFRLLFVLAHDHRRLVHVAVPGWVRGFRARCGVVHLENAIVETDAPYIYRAIAIRSFAEVATAITATTRRRPRRDFSRFT
jgi:hypothetical protein